MLEQNTDYKWISKIRNILNECGKTDVWIYQPYLNIHSVHKQIKLTLTDLFKQHWNSQLDSSNKPKNYKTFKLSLDYL